MKGLDVMSQSFKRGLMILDLFSVERPVITLEEIATEINISPITAYRYVKVLCESGMLVMEEGKIQISAKILRFTNLFTKQDPMIAIAIEPINNLSHEFNETIALCKLEGTDVVCIHRVESSLSLRSSFSIGQRMSIHAGAFARTIAAFLPESELKSIVRKTELIPFTKRTIVDRKEFEVRLGQIRQKSFDLSREEVDSGVVAMAVPILVSGRIVGSLGLAMPSLRYKPTYEQKIIDRLQEVAEHISNEIRKLNYL